MPNYKIYFNDKPIILTSDEDYGRVHAGTRDFLFSQYGGKTKQLFQFIDTLEKPTSFKGVVLYHKNYKKLKKDFKSLFSIIHASGGIVHNPNGKILFIFRKGHWDLPKGKIDPGETRKEAAVREVMEETGAKKIQVENRFTRTKHVYRDGKGNRVLKICTWYIMYAPDQPLVPETSESIQKAVWSSSAEVLSRKEPIYANILGLLQEYHNNF